MIKTTFAALALSICALTTTAQANDIFSYTLIEAEIVRHEGGDTGLELESHGWIGGDVYKFAWSLDAEHDENDFEAAEAQAYVRRMISPFFDVKAGLRQDIEPDPLSYAMVGVEGLAPYWFEVDAEAFLSENGDVSTRIEVEYELLFTQRLIGTPHVEIEAFANDVPELERGSGLATTEVGFQLRYEITRKLAPYVDLTYERSYGGTADFARAAGEDDESMAIRFGLRVIF